MILESSASWCNVGESIEDWRVAAVSALVSMLALETAMIEQFGAEEDAGFRLVTTSCTGAFVILAVFVLAVYMIVWATVRLREWR